MNLPPDIAAAIHAYSRAVAEAERLRLEAEYAMRIAADPPGPAMCPDSGALKDKRGAALELGVSIATLDRLVVAGAPFEQVGHRRRFDVPKLRAWLASRPKQAARRKVDDDGINVDSIARAAGLRLVSAGGAK